MSVNARPRAEQTFAWFTNQNFSENPATPDPNANDFRLWSQAVVVAACRGNMITSWKTSNLAHRGGKELRILDAETSVLDLLAVTPAPKGNDEVTSLELSYGIRGKPNDNALSSFQWVSPRTCDSIWHRARAVITCRDGEAKASVAVTGSQFPSHRVWINNEMASPTLAQGPFSDLWVCNPSTPELVQ
jgi:hypothetical protein